MSHDLTPDEFDDLCDDMVAGIASADDCKAIACWCRHHTELDLLVAEGRLAVPGRAA